MDGTAERDSAEVAVSDLLNRLHADELADRDRERARCRALILVELLRKFIHERKKPKPG